MRLLILLTLLSWVVSGVASFIVLFLGRFTVKGTSLRDWVVLRAPKLVSEAFSCDFCLCWWTCLALCLVCVPLLGVWAVLAAPVAAPVARALVA